MSEHDGYQSPFTWRYGSDTMRRVFSEQHRRKLWRRVWVALARAQADAGLVTPEQLADIEAHADEIDLERSLAIEAVTRHDVMAEIKTFAEQCPVGGGVIHLGATSMDVVDNAEILRQREALDLVLARLRMLIGIFLHIPACRQGPWQTLFTPVRSSKLLRPKLRLPHFRRPRSLSRHLVPSVWPLGEF